jgi:hypothetical protein
MLSSIEKIIKQNNILVNLQKKCILEIEKSKAKKNPSIKTKTKTKTKILSSIEKMSKIIKKQRRILIKLVEKCSLDIENAKKKTKVNQFKNMLDKLITAMDEYETKYNDLIALTPTILLQE